jgi:Ca-activated chloride channel family protein
VPHLFDAQYMAANDRWLATLEDQPGAYLRARLALEQKARIKAGTALPDPEDPQ